MSDLSMPAQDWPARNYMVTFATVIATDPGVYQLGSSDSAAITGAVDAYASALTIATEPATRTELTIIEKDRAWNDEAARKQLLTVFEAAGHASEIARNGRRRLSAILFS